MALFGEKRDGQFWSFAYKRKKCERFESLKTHIPIMLLINSCAIQIDLLLIFLLTMIENQPIYYYNIFYFYW